MSIQEGETFRTVKVLPGRVVVILSEGPFSTTKPVPKELGTYEYKPIGRIWRSDTEHGSWIPVFDWVLGRRGRQAPSLMDLPEIG